jgi:hypothetical protein
MRSEREETLIRQTLSTWQERYPILLSKDDARQIITNVTDFFSLLEEWERHSDTGTSEKPPTETTGGGERAA